MFPNLNYFDQALKRNLLFQSKYRGKKKKPKQTRQHIVIGLFLSINFRNMGCKWQCLQTEIISTLLTKKGQGSIRKHLTAMYALIQDEHWSG